MTVEEMLSFWAWIHYSEKVWFYADTESMTTDWIMLEEVEQ